MQTLEPMNTFRVDFDDGDYLITGFRGTLNDAEKYYIGTKFEKRNETMHTAIKVTQLKVTVTDLNK